MKTFEEYRFRVKHSAISVNKNEEIIIPNISIDGYGNAVYRGLSTVKLPVSAKWVIWNDPYHKDMHLNYFPEFMSNIGYYEVDFEEINPSLIVKGFDTLKDAARYMLDNCDSHYDSDNALNNFVNGFDETEYAAGTDIVNDDERAREYDAISSYIRAFESRGLDTKDKYGSRLKEKDFEEILKQCLKANNL